MRKIAPYSEFRALCDSEFRALCDEVGGPVYLGSGFPAAALQSEPGAIDPFELCCRKYPVSLVLPVLCRFQKKRRRSEADAAAKEANTTAIARRHWPLVAFALSQYHYERKERQKYTDEPSPKQVRELLLDLEQAINKSASLICELQSLSFRLPDSNSPDRRSHLAWLDVFISQAIAGRKPDGSTNDDPEQLAFDYDVKRLFLHRMAGIAAAAHAGAEYIDRNLLKRTAGPDDPALENLVFRGKKIWKSLTGRHASAEKVESNTNGPDPDFVIFLQELVKIDPQKAELPSRDQIANCLRKLRQKKLPQ